MEVRVEGSGKGRVTRLLKHRDGRLFASVTDLRSWRVRVPSAETISCQGTDFVALDSIHGLRYEIDEARQEATIRLPSAALDRTVFGSPEARSPADPVPLGGFVNYEIQTLVTPEQTRHNGLFEAGVFNLHGVMLGTFLWEGSAPDRPLIRLDSTWTYDRPDRRASLRLGDAVSRGGTWGRPARFGGFQWATNFATQPGFIAFPLPTLSGTAELPSTLELYADNVLRMRETVPQGPFEIADFPVVSGAGDVQMVVRDLLGREQVITQPYYASQSLLRKGLHDYSYDAGFVRTGYGTPNSRYGSFLAAATHRLGLSDVLTGELRAEFLRERQSLGVGATRLVPILGPASFAVAGSRSRSGMDGLVMLGLERQSRSFSYAVQTRYISRRFEAFPSPFARGIPRQTSSAHLGAPLGRGRTISFSYLQQDYWEAQRLRLTSASYGMRLNRELFLHVFAFHHNNRFSGGITLTRSLSRRTTASVRADRNSEGSRTAARVQRNLPEGDGIGYRLDLDQGRQQRAEAGISFQTGKGTYRVEAAHSQSRTGYRLGASGGVAVLGRRPFLTRRVNESFGVVHVPDSPGVRVYVENQVVGRTDRRGLALVPRLRAFQRNAVRIENSDLSIGHRVDALEMNVTPVYRSGVMAIFPVRSTGSALLRLVLEDGSFLPAGAKLRLSRTEEEFPVAYRGEVFVTGLSSRNRIEAVWNGRTCRVDFDLPTDSGPLPEIGPLTCRESLP